VGVRWRVSLLGRLSLAREGETITRFRRRATAKLLTYLALNLGRDVLRDTLGDLLWPDVDPTVARRRLSEELSSLRRQLEPAGFSRGSVLIAESDRVRLSDEAVECDVLLFTRKLALANRSRTAEGRIELLQAADALYQGELAPGYYDEWIDDARMPLAETHARVLSQLTDLFAKAEDWASASEYGLRLLAVDDAAEAKVKDLLQRAGQVLPVPPIPAPKPAAPEGTKPKRGGPNLPYLRTSFFGREAEIALALERLAEPRTSLLTLTGLGGCGKTRLSVELGERLVPEYQGRVWFVPLAEEEGREGILRAVMGSLRLPTTSDPLEAIRAVLAEGEASLLILDNFEHLADDYAEVVEDLRRLSPTLKVIVTSRARLGLEGENELPLPTLAVPEETGLPPEALLAFPSVRLFVGRAQSARPDFGLTDANAETVADICRRLEGIPLALELAAGWISTLGIVQIRARLDGADAFPYSRRADIAPRHRTLAATLDYSYDLLSERLRGPFAGLSVFRGGWTLEAFEAVIGEGDALAVVDDLVARSLVSGQPPFFRLLETVREYGWEKLTPEDRQRLQLAHAEYYTQLAERLELDNETYAELAKVGPYLANFKVALEFYWEAGAFDRFARLVLALAAYWTRGGEEVYARERLEELLRRAPEMDRVSVARIHGLLGLILNRKERYEEASAHAMAAVEVYRELGDEARLAQALNLLAVHYTYVLRFDDAERLLLETKERAARSGNASAYRNAVGNLGIVAINRGDFEAGLKLFAEIPAENELPVARLRFHENIAHTLISMGRFEDARPHAEDALRIAQRVGARAESAGPYLCLGALAVQRGQVKLGLRLAIDAAEIYRRYGETYMARYPLDFAAQTLARHGYARHAVPLYVANDVRLAPYWAYYIGAIFGETRPLREVLIGELGEEEFEYGRLRASSEGIGAFLRRLRTELG
jgi:predicted ATPase/DNA-binding SARP family transcriptional activator